MSHETAEMSHDSMSVRSAVLYNVRYKVWKRRKLIWYYWRHKALKKFTPPALGAIRYRL